ncbi:MAG: hypothetical protein ABIH89_00190 [Elusimicrobiota bacterium]
MIKDKQLTEWYGNVSDKKNNELTRILDVEYAHLTLENKDDLYITKYGLSFIENLKPENFLLDKEWYNNNSTKLSGTSSIYKVKTKRVNNKSKEIVVKWNRMGQDIPGIDETSDLLNAEFNSPFEEFSLVMELREQLYNAKEKLALQKPLAIYVPSKNVDPFRLGRKVYKMKDVIASHTDIELDMCRPYAMIYEWIKGVDVTCACKEYNLNEYFMEILTIKGEDKIQNYGYTVLDRKPHHIIVRSEKKSGLLRDKDGKIVFGLVDYELLNRIPERDNEIRRLRRAEYLTRQRDRFSEENIKTFHPHLAYENVLGVDYVYGLVGSTKGRLWVVGKDPFLYDYFLPERWEHTPKTRISKSNEMYHTKTKDNINIVWKLSKVGIKPELDPFKEDEEAIMEYGYNSPFEEIAIAIDLSNKGVPTIYPRAVYMPGGEIEIPQNVYDDGRYKSHSELKTSDDVPILSKDHDYILIWGYWNGPDELLAVRDGVYYEGVDMLKAYREEIISKEEYLSFLEITKDRLNRLGYDALSLRGNHLLLSIDDAGNIVKDDEGNIELRICNFEFLKRDKL